LVSTPWETHVFPDSSSSNVTNDIMLIPYIRFVIQKPSYMCSKSNARGS